MAFLKSEQYDYPVQQRAYLYPEVRTKTELCHALLDPYDGFGCVYKYNLMSSHTPLENCGLESPWDLEDLVKAGRKARCCPYFASRDLIATADIVFCPYVYLIDPKIRKSMQLDLRGTVILLDEAHNIEDSCRDAGSYSVLLDEIFQAKMDCEKVAAMEILPEIHNKLARFLCNLMNWMSQKVHLQTDNMKMETSSLDGVNAVASFEKYNINCQSIVEFKENVMEAIANVNKEEQVKNSKQQFERDGLLPVTTFVLEGLSLVLGFMYDNNMKHIRDYYVAVSKNPILSTASRTDMPDDWLNTSGRPRLIVEEDFPNLAWGSYLSFLCMNPSVVFQPIADMVRSIVLTSGTLAPLVTFNSELGTTFANELQALHIIDENQV